MKWKSKSRAGSGDDGEDDDQVGGEKKRNGGKKRKEMEKRRKEEKRKRKEEERGKRSQKMKKKKKETTRTQRGHREDAERVKKRGKKMGTKGKKKKQRTEGREGERGRKEGEGREDGRKGGRKEGRKEGRKKGRKETQRAVAQVFVCALHRICCKCGARQQSRVVSFLCMERCGKSRWQKAVASQPSGRDSRSRTHRTMLPPPAALVQRRSPALRPLPFSHSLGSRLPSRASPEGINTPAL